VRNCSMFRISACFLLLILGGCFPVSTYYREGVTYDTLERATTQCEVLALQQAPIDREIRQGPDRYVPRRKSCDSEGNCSERGGYWRPGRIYTVDVNEDLSDRIERQCMADKGYRPERIPICPAGSADSVLDSPSARLPVLTPQSCAIRRGDGRFQVAIKR